MTKPMLLASRPRLPEGEGQPAHVAGVAALPEVDDALEVVVGGVGAVVGAIFRLADRDPVATEEHVAVLAVEVAYRGTRSSPHCGSGLQRNT